MSANPLSEKLIPTGSTSNGSPKRPHLIIQGDNLDVLETLVPSHENTVDLIYIDPPYNTGDTTRKYRDEYSLWIEFMRVRLELAQKLLAPLGVIVIAIGDNELIRLRTLTDQVMGSDNYLTTIVWQGGLTNSARFTGGGIDYMVAYGKNRTAMIDADIRWGEPKPGVGLVLNAGADAWAESDHDAVEATRLFRAWWKTREHDFAGGMHEYCRIDETGRVFRIGYLGAGTGRPGKQFTVPHPKTRQTVLIPGGGWICSEKTMTRLIAEDRVLFGADETTAPSRKLFLNEFETQAPSPTFSQRRDSGTIHLKNVLGGHRFSNPKDHLVLARWFDLMAPSNAVILDFFGGSGTTVDAVMHLNQADGGTRTSILVTNNELSAKESDRFAGAGITAGHAEWEAAGVFQNVTRPRVETIVSGIRSDGSTYSAGYQENVQFFEFRGSVA